MTHYIRALGLAASLTLAFVCIAATPASPYVGITAPTLMKEIDSRGAKHVIETLSNDQSAWQYVRAKIAKGSLEWLGVAAKLQAGADGHMGEELIHSVGEALENEPQNVLTDLEESLFKIQVVCDSPDIDDVRYATYKKAIISLLRRESAVSRVNQKDLKTVRDRCLESLDKNRAPLMRYFGVHDAS